MYMIRCRTTLLFFFYVRIKQHLKCWDVVGAITQTQCLPSSVPLEQRTPESTGSVEKEADLWVHCIWPSLSVSSAESVCCWCWDSLGLDEGAYWLFTVLTSLSASSGMFGLLMRTTVRQRTVGVCVWACACICIEISSAHHTGRWYTGSECVRARGLLVCNIR